MDNQGVADWRAVSGGATFATRTVGGACPGTPPAGMTCHAADMETSFDIITFSPVPENSTTLNLLTTTVPGVLLRIEQ
jgi:hypothetical protein